MESLGSKPTVLFILHLPPPVHGASMMGKYIYDSRLVNGKFDSHYINLSTAKDLADIGKVGLKKLVNFIGLLRKIRKEVRRLRPQLVYVTPNACGGAFYKDFLVVEMLKRMGCRVIVHYHNKGVATRQDRKFDDRLYKKFFKGIKVILLSEKLYDDVKKYVKREDVFFCPNGIPDNCKDENKEERTCRFVPRLLFLSNLIESKGVIVLLDALKILKDKGYSFICNFVGGETAEIDASRFKAEIEKRNLNNIALYIGRKYGADKERIFNQSDIFVFPTFYHNECFPLVLLEAMRHGLPCISTNEAGIPDIIDDGKTGLIVPKKDSEALADAIEKLINDRNLCRQMGHEGRKKYEDKFTLAVFERNICGILNEYSK